MHDVDAERHHVAALGGHRHRVLQVPVVGGKVRRAGRPVGLGDDVVQGATLVRAVEEADAAVVVVGVVEVDQAVDVATVGVPVERPVLVHGEGVAGLRRLGVERRVMQFDVRTDEVGHGACQCGVGHGVAPGLGIPVQVVQGDELRAPLHVPGHVHAPPAAAPTGALARPGGDLPVEIVGEFVGLALAEHGREVQVAVRVEEGDLGVGQFVVGLVGRAHGRRLGVKTMKSDSTIIGGMAQN